MLSVNAPKCSLPAPETCNPVCGYTIYHKNQNGEAKEGSANEDRDSTSEDENRVDESSSKRSDKSTEEDHELVFEDAKGRVIDSEQDAKVTENNKNMPIPLKDDIIIKLEPKAKGLQKKKHEDDDDTMAGVLSEANADTKKHEEEEKNEEGDIKINSEQNIINGENSNSLEHEGGGENGEVEVFEPVPLRNKASGSAIEAEQTTSTE